MIKSKVLEQIGGTLDEWLVGFNSKDDFKISLMGTEKLNLKNLILNVDKVNESLADTPYKLKCGMIGKVTFKVSRKSFI